MGQKVELDGSEIALQFKEAIHRLMEFNRLYDSGQRFFARDIAASVFQMTVNSGKNTSFLRHLDIEDDVRFKSLKTNRVSTDNLLPENVLVVMQMRDDSTTCHVDWLPLDPKEFNFLLDWLHPREWLRERIIKGPGKEFWSRQQLISTVRNIEGSHVDRYVSESFKKLKDGNPFGVGIMSHKPILIQPYSHVYAAVRHIGGELEESVKAFVKV